MPHKNKEPAEPPIVATTPEGLSIVTEIDHLTEEVLTPPKTEPPISTRTANAMRTVGHVFYALAIGFGLVVGGVLLMNRFAADGIFGLQFSVESVSVIEKLPRGTLLVVAHRSPDKIKPNDIITYYALPGQANSRVTRYVLAVERNEDNDNYSIQTCRSPGAPADSIKINPTNVLGVKVAAFPGAGYVLSFLQDYSFLLGAMAVLLSLAALLLQGWLAEQKRQKRILAPEELAREEEA